MPSSKRLLTKAAMTCFICSTPFLLCAQSSDAPDSSTPDEPSPTANKITEPTPEMLKMSPAELFKIVDLDGNGQVSYAETAKTLEHSPKHGRRKFAKCDKDKSGGLNLKEFEVRLTRTEWWKLSRKTPEAMFKAADINKDGALSKEEFAVFQGKEAHLDTFFKRADKNSSGDLDLKEAFAHINEEIFPSRKLKNIKKANRNKEKGSGQ